MTISPDLGLTDFELRPDMILSLFFYKIKKLNMIVS